MFKRFICKLFERIEPVDENTEKIRKILSTLDYEPKLEIMAFDVPTSKLIMLGDGRSIRPRNPTYYIINSSHEDLVNMPISLMVRYCARAIRCRRQSGDNKLETFIDVYPRVSAELKEIISFMSFNTWGDYDADAQIVALIAEYLYREDHSLEDVAKMILMDASQIIEDFEIR